MSGEFTHLDDKGKAKMVEIAHKQESARKAVAKGSVYMKSETMNKIEEQELTKGDVLGTARVAGIMGTKKTDDLIPMCHPLMITGISIDFDFDYSNSKIEIETVVKTTGKTGVEMEALTGVSIAALTIYDMSKSVDKKMQISEVRLVEKSGGESGDIVNE